MQIDHKVKSILYVEDEKTIQEELSDFLSMFCEKIYIADDGFQGLELYHRHSPDIIISDIRMPVMDGLEMCKKIKQHNQDAHIIFTTAFSDMEYFMQAIELQVDGYVLKPVSLLLMEKKILEIAKNIELKQELKQKEDMLIQASKLASMGEMIGNIAHQWKQPLAAISADVGNIKIDSELNNLTTEALLDYAGRIEKQVVYLSKTIDDFRSFFTPKKFSASYDMKQFLEKCIDLVSSSFESNMIETIQKIDDRINTYGDPNQLTQAIINILNNAKDALVEASDLNNKLVFVLTVKKLEDDAIQIVIKDNAGGIPESIIGRVFEPYFTTKKNNGGTGLGLYITHTIITQHLKGSIWVENVIFNHNDKEYKGAQFTLTLPLKMD